MVPVDHYLWLSLALFTIGVIGVLTRRNVIIILMSIELILNAVNINLVAFSHMFGNVDGQVFAIFIITDAAAEAAVGLGIEMRPKIHLIAGRWFTPGQREVVVSSSINRRFEHANIGDMVRIGKGDWPIVGIFDGSGTAHDSEIWGDINQLVTDFERTVYSSVLVRATDPASAQALKNRANDDQRLELNGLLEPDYYASQTKSGAPIKIVGWIVAFIMAVGSCFAAANTMYAAVAYRGREIATLRVIGFSRPSILTSFMLESLLLSLLGAALGILLMLPFNGMTTGTQNQVTFSEVVFSLQMTPVVVFSAIVFALIMGVVGGFAPAWHASRRDMLSALRD